MKTYEIQTTEDNIFPNEHGEFDIYIKDHEIFSHNIGKLCIVVTENSNMCENIDCIITTGEGIINRCTLDQDEPENEEFQTIFPAENVPLSLSFHMQNIIIFRGTGINFDNCDKFIIKLYFTAYDIGSENITNISSIRYIDWENDIKGNRLAFMDGMCGTTLCFDSNSDYKSDVLGPIETVSENDVLLVERVITKYNNSFNLTPLIYVLVESKELFCKKECIVMQRVRYPMVQYGSKLVSHFHFVGDAVKNIKVNLPNGVNIKDITLSYERCKEHDHQQITIPESQYYVDDDDNLNICANDETTFLILTTQIKNPKLEIHLDSVLGDNNAIEIEYDRSVFSIALRSQLVDATNFYTTNMIHDVIDYSYPKINTGGVLYGP
jgi:hypothetical protein